MILGSFLFAFLNRVIQFPKRFGISPSEPSAAHAKVLSSARSVFVLMTDSFSTLGGADLSGLLTCKFAVSQVPRVFAFCDAAIFRRAANVGVAAQPSPVPAKELFEAQVAIYNLRNPQQKKSSPELTKKKSATMISSASSVSSSGGEEKNRSGTVFKNLFGGLKSPRGEQKSEQNKGSASPPPITKSGRAADSPSPRSGKKSDLPPELAAALQNVQRGKTVTVAEAQQMLSPRSEEKDRAAPPSRGPAAAAAAATGGGGPKLETTASVAAIPSKAVPITPTKQEPKTESAKVADAPPVSSSPPPAAKPAATANLQMSIPEFGLGIEQFALPEWKPGDLVCAQWDEDKCWYKVG